MDKQEKIVCAAIRNWMGKSENIVLYVEYPDHLTESLYQVGDIGYEKGFVTNKNRFVDAKEAMEIAVSCGQVKNDFMLLSDPPQYGDLKPSDLY